MDRFYTGQKLTARDLNAAFDSVAGVTNPSDDYKWQQTSLGRMQKTWDRFSNRQNQLAPPLQLDISFEKLDNPIAWKGRSIGAKRRLFMNVGQWKATMFRGGLSFAGCIPDLGTYNGIPFIGAIGWQMQSSSSVLGGDGKPHWSMWSYVGNEPKPEDDLQQWAQVQKLDQDNVCRNASPLNWWYTGIELEQAPADVMIEPKYGFSDIVAYPLLVEVKWKDTDGGASTNPNCVAVLVVSTAIDYFMKAALLAVHMQSLADAIQTYYGAERNFNFEVKQLKLPDTPEQCVKLAAMQWRTGFFDASIKQLTNTVEFVHDYSAWRVERSSAVQYDISLPQWIDLGGVHHVGGLPVDGELVDKNGEPVPLEDAGNYPYAAMCMAIDQSTGETQTSCVAIQEEIQPDDDIAGNLLSSLFNGLSAASKRLVWVASNDGKAVQYYDTCPDFRTELADAEAKLADTVQASIQHQISALETDEEDLFAEQQQARFLQLYKFGDQEYRETFPSPQVLNSLEADGYHYDVLTRITTPSEGSGKGSTILHYESLSSLYQQLSGEGGGGVSACISALGNLSDDNVVVDCQGKLLKFDTGISSNVEIDVKQDENDKGVVNVKFGVFYI